MATPNTPAQVLVIPCSGIGKVQGLISREAVYHVTDKLLPGQSDTVCLALLVTGDAATRNKVQSQPCITVDGCPKLCAKKNVELSGGQVALGVRVFDTLKRHRGAQFGSPTALTAEGWAAAKEIAEEIARTAQQVLGPTIDNCAAHEPVIQAFPHEAPAPDGRRRIIGCAGRNKQE